MADQPPILVGISGASGGAIAVHALKALSSANVPVVLVVSEGGRAVLAEECGLTPADLSPYVTSEYADRDLAAPFASGSRATRGMLVVPCSGSTVAKMAAGIADSLLLRAAQVHLKERRPLVIVPRETPLSTILLRNLLTLSESGVVILDAAPAFYLKPRSVDELAQYLAGKALDHLGVPHALYRGWRAEAR